MQTFPREPEDIEPVSTLWEDNCSFTTEDGAAELTQVRIARTLYVDKLRMLNALAVMQASIACRAVRTCDMYFEVHLGSPWNAALTFKKKSGRLPPRKKVALTPNFRQIQITSEEPRKKDERYDQYCRATVQISRSMARLPDHFLQDSSLARRWQEDSNS